MVKEMDMPSRTLRNELVLLVYRLLWVTVTIGDEGMVNWGLEKTKMSLYFSLDLVQSRHCPWQLHRC